MRRALPPIPAPSQETVDRINEFAAVPIERRMFPVLDHDVLATRRDGEKVVDAHGGTRWDYLDFDGVDVASPSFLQAIHQAWPWAVPTNMSDDVAAAWEFVMERSRTNPALDHSCHASCPCRTQGAEA